MADPDAYAVVSKGLLAKTGRDLDAWVAVARASAVAGHKALLDHLKAVHGLTHGYANTVAHAANASAAASIDDDDLMEAMFAGPKAGMRPIYDTIVAAVRGFGGDIELSPKKGYVSLRRKKQFAIAQPSTKDRFDLGLNLKGEPATVRLEASGSWNVMVSHRVRIADASEVDTELHGWLRAAYDRA